MKKNNLPSKLVWGGLLIAVIFSVALIIFQRQRTVLKVTLLKPPLVYIGEEQAREVSKKVAQIKTGIALTRSDNIDESRRWITEKFALRYDISDRTLSRPEALKRYPRGVVYAVIDIRKKGRRYALLIDGNDTPDLSLYDKAQTKPIVTYVYERGRWLAAAGDEISIREMHKIINDTTLDDLEKELSKHDKEVLLKNF